MSFSKIRIPFVAILFSITLWSCNSGGISGKIAGGEGEMLKIYELQNNKITALDSVQVDSKGTFQLSNAGLEPNFYYLGFDSKKMLLLFTDSTESIVVETTKEDIDKPSSIAGSANSSKYQEFQKLMKPIDKNLADLTNALNARPDKKEQLQLQQDRAKAQEEKRAACKTFIKENKGNPISMVALQGLDISKDMKFYDGVIRDTKASIGNTKLHKNLSSQISSIKKQMAATKEPKGSAGMAPGTTVPEIEMAGVDGKTLKLSDLRGKVVLIDFWASWCAPCRRENPNVVAMYNKYHKDGFEVFSVSLDGTKDRWIKAIEKDGLIWPWHVSDLKKWNNAAAAAYGVHSIPHGLLIDREGKVIQEKLRGAALQTKLAEIFGH